MSGKKTTSGQKAWAISKVALGWAGGIFASAIAQAAPEPGLIPLRGTLVEVPIVEVFIPKTGYDDNDRVEAVAAGWLPNPCYTISGASAEKMPDGKRFVIHQWAWKEMTGPCGSGDLIDEPVPYSSEVNLGLLNEASYEFRFRKPGGSPGVRTFSVKKATLDAVDNFNYAVVTNVEMSGIFDGRQEVTATLNGIHPNLCTDLERPLKIERQDDVIIVQPVVREEQVNCVRRSRPYKEKISLGVLPPGDYLLHVRSRNGKAVNQLFTVMR